MQWWRWVGWLVVGCAVLLMLPQYWATRRPEVTHTVAICNMQPEDVAASANQLRQSLQQGGIEVSASDAAGYRESIAQATKSSVNSMSCSLLLGMYPHLRINAHLTHAEALTSIRNGLTSVGDPNAFSRRTY